MSEYNQSLDWLSIYQVVDLEHGCLEVGDISLTLETSEGCLTIISLQSGYISG